MKRTSNLLWVIIPIAGIVLFGLWLLLPYPNKIAIELANTEPIATTPAGGGTGSYSQNAIAVSVENVQSVIATLERPGSYSADYIVTLFWETGSQEFPITLSVDTDAVNINGTTYTQQEVQSRDTLSMLPTYEDVLEIDVGKITDASYAIYNDEAYITVSFYGLMYRHEYYISIKSGILEYARKYDGETLVYSADIVKAVSN